MKNKRGQVTIFIIISVIIIAVALLFYYLSPSIGITTQKAKNPPQFIETCIIKDLKNNIEKISLQGGSLNPENHFTYNNINIDYLCYAENNYDLCVIQQPLLTQHIESEIKDSIEGTVDSCFNSLNQNYEEKGYNVNIKTGTTNIEILPEKIITNLDYEVTLAKESSEKYEDFDIILNNNLYELISISNSILEWEATYGDSDPTNYMNYYPDIKVEKNLRNDGTKIYTVSNRDSKNKFQFATKSLVLPPGY